LFNNILVFYNYAYSTTSVLVKAMMDKHGLELRRGILQLKKEMLRLQEELLEWEMKQ